MMERCNTRGLPVVIAAFICELFRARYSIISRTAVIHYRRARISATFGYPLLLARLSLATEPTGIVKDSTM